MPLNQRHPLPGDPVRDQVAQDEVAATDCSAMKLMLMARYMRLSIMKSTPTPRLLMSGSDKGYGDAEQRHLVCS
jgi:hypothetical protein